MKLKEKIVKVCSGVMLSIVVLVTPVLAAAEDFDRGTGTVYVPKNKDMAVAEENVERSLAYSYVMTKANSVYPNTANGYIQDTYTRCYIQWFNTKGTPITNKVKLTEGYLMEIHINEGYLNSNNITLKISGHHKDYDAYVAYYYNGK